MMGYKREACIAGVMMFGLVGPAGCGGSPDPVDSGAAETTTADPASVGETTNALNSSCDPRYGYITNESITNGSVLYEGWCFTGGHTLIVWITDWNTGRQIGPEQFVTALPDNFFIPGFFSGTIPGCPSTGQDMLHVIDWSAQRRADQGPFNIHCP